ncbi:hypothetical protein TDB9533_04724 [Thalassocella blandensis]|nr:hypothetical protein TDB9533_04724 [Thalassocella blandensis]
MDYSLNKFTPSTTPKSRTKTSAQHARAPQKNANSQKNNTESKSGKPSGKPPSAPPNFSRPLNANAQNLKPAQTSLSKQEHGAAQYSNMQAFNFGTDPSASYRHLNFKDKSESFTDKLKFWRPDSQLNIPQKSAMAEKLQNDTGRVAAALTGQTAQEGVSHSISSQINNLREGAALGLSRHNKIDVAGGSNISVMSFMAPGTTTAIKSAGVDIGWGPSLAVDANVKHDRFNAINISRPADAEQTLLTGTHGRNTDVKVNLHAKVSAGAGADNGAFIGPAVQGSLGTGVSHAHMNIYHHTSSDPGAKAEDMMNFISMNGKETFSGQQWSSPETSSTTKIPVAFKLEGSVMGKSPAYGDAEHGIRHVGGLGASVSVGVGDIMHPQSSAFVKGEAGGSINTSIAGKSFTNDEAGAISGIAARLPQGLKFESQATPLHSQPSAQQSYHMSYVNHPFGHGSHAHRLEEKYGEGTLERIDQGFRDAFDHDDIPNRRKTVIEKTFDDGRTEIHGRFEVTARQGHTHKIPTVPISYSSYSEGKVDSDTRLLFTIPPKSPN